MSISYTLEPFKKQLALEDLVKKKYSNLHQNTWHDFFLTEQVFFSDYVLLRLLVKCICIS